MPPCLDVYSVSQRRDRESIESFLDTYVDRPKSDTQTPSQLMALPLGFDGDEDQLAIDDWDWIDVDTLDDAFEVGLDHPHRAFSIYLRAVEPWCGALLSFTSDGRIVFGVSVDDPLGSPLALTEARRAMAQLWSETEGDRAWIECEQPPPLDVEGHAPWSQAIASIDESGPGLTIVYTEDAMLISQVPYRSWVEVQDEFPDYKASLGPFTVADLLDFVEFEYPKDPPFRRTSVERFAKGVEARRLWARKASSADQQPSSNMKPFVTVADTFELTDRALTLMPDVPIDVPVGRYQARARRPNGPEFEVDIQVEHQHFSPGGYKNVVSAPYSSKDELPAGTEIFVD